MLNFLKNITPTELIIIALILIVVFGSKTVTRLGRAGGESLKEIKKIKKNISEAVEDDEPQKTEKGVSK